MAASSKGVTDPTDRPNRNGRALAGVADGAAPAEVSDPVVADGRRLESGGPAPPTAAQRPTPAPRRPAWVKPVLLAGLAGVLVIGAVMGIRYFRFAATHVSTDDAQTTGDIIQISPQVSGTVKQVFVHENQEVRKGDLLVVLDDADYRAAYDQAKANLDAAIAQARGAGVSVALTSATGSAQVLQAQGGLSQAESAISSANADVAKAMAGVANARAMAKSADANILNGQAAVTAAIANKQRYADAIRSAQAQVDTARAGVRAAQAAATAAQAVAERATKDAARYATLVSQGAVSQQAADTATAAARQAAAQLAAANEQVAQAQAQVAERQADLNASRQQLDWADAGIAQARAQLDAVREQDAAARAGIVQARAQQTAARDSVQQAEARRTQALGQLKQARTAPQQVSVSSSAAAQAQAKIGQARAALDAARIQLDYTRIYAPANGRVSKKTVEVGTLEQPGTPLMAIVPDNDIWVVANYKETQFVGVRPNRRATIDVDAIPGRTFQGHVDSISAGTGAVFSLLPPDNATGNFTKVVQRIPVKIVFEPGQPDLDRLRVGMNVTATVETK